MTKKSNIEFINLHAHDVFSIGDGFGYPAEHFDYAYDNGLKAHSITNHGNLNSLVYVKHHLEKMRKEGKEFRAQYGVEAYFVPSVKEWEVLFEESKANKKIKRISVSAKASIEDDRKIIDPLKERWHLTMLAQNQTGLNNIFEMVSVSNTKPYFYSYPRMDYDLLDSHRDGIICLSGCMGGLASSAYWKYEHEGETRVRKEMQIIFDNMRNILGDNWYGEIQWNSVKKQHIINKHVIDICQDMNIPLISTADCHYPSPDKWKDREMYIRLAWLGRGGCDWLGEMPETIEDMNYELYPKNGDQMWADYKRYTKKMMVDYDDRLILESIKRSSEVVFDKIDDFVPDTTIRLPSFVVSDGLDADTDLKKRTVTALAHKGFAENKTYIERLDRELNVLKEQGFSKYFLTMHAISNKAKERGLTGTGRGSAAGSLIAYLLDITQVDPIKYNLLFERFLTAGSKSMPDIDYDIPDPMEFKEQLIEDWGTSNVVPIVNYNKLALKSLVKNLSKYYEIPYFEVNDMTAKMDEETIPAAKKARGIKSGEYSPTLEDYLEHSTSFKSFITKYPKIKEYLPGILGQVSSLSRHAGGVVVGENLDRLMPLINIKGVVHTPWPEGQFVRQLEPMGFIKFDILGLTTLKIIKTTIENILLSGLGRLPTSEEISSFYNEKLHPDNIDFNDNNVWKEVFHDGNFVGTFQFTNGGAQHFCKEVKPNSIEELSNITSIYRPGPLGAGVDKEYLKSKINGMKSTLCPELKKCLATTHGLLVYQEQIATAAHLLGDGISLDDGNMLRKVLTKKGTGKEIEIKEKLFEKFIRGCDSKGMSYVESKDIWDEFELHSKYSFNRSHAISYSMISYQCAYLFHHYKIEWCAAFLDANAIKKDKRIESIALVRAQGFDIEPVDINLSGSRWTPSKDSKTLFQPFVSIKNIGLKAIEEILKNKPYKSPEDIFLNKNISGRAVNVKVLNSLLLSGALDSLMDNRFTGRKHFWSAMVVDRPKTFKRMNENIETYRNEGSFTKEEEINFVSSLTGVYPLEKVVDSILLDKFEENSCPPMSEFDPDRLIGWIVPIEVIEKRTSKSNKRFLLINGTDINSKTTTIKCWGISDTETIHVNRPYIVRPDSDPKWGYSTRGPLSKTWKLLG